MGPLRVRWRDEQTPPRSLDDRLVVLLAADSAELSPSEPHIALINDLDFFFLVREDLPTTSADIFFWIPYWSDSRQEVQAGANDLARTRAYLPYYLTFLDASLRCRNPRLPESFAWDEAGLLPILPTSDEPDQTAEDVIRRHLQRLLELRPPGFVEVAEGGPVRDPRFDGADQGESRHYVVRIQGNLRKGDLFHVFFRVHNARALRLGPRTAQAVYHYYDATHHPALTGQPYSREPVIPCAMLHASLRSKLPLARVTDAEGKPATFARAPRQTEVPAASPTGYRYHDAYWFTLFNAHRGPQGGKFVARWTYATHAYHTTLRWAASPLRTFWRQRETDRQLIQGAVARLTEEGLIPAVMRTLEGVAAGKTIKELARERRLAVKTIRNYYARAVTEMGLSGRTLDAAKRRHLIALAVELHHYLEENGLGLEMLEAEANDASAEKTPSS